VETELIGTRLIKTGESAYHQRGITSEVEVQPRRKVFQGIGRTLDHAWFRRLPLRVEFFSNSGSDIESVREMQHCISAQNEIIAALFHYLLNSLNQVRCVGLLELLTTLVKEVLNFL